MCGRYAMPDDEAIGEYWAVSCRIWLSAAMPRFNVAPTAQVPILVRGPGGAPEPKVARWGLIPPWWSQDAPPSRTFNARSEDAARKPLWREGLRRSRCLMPARGWYEWNADEPVPGAAGRMGKQPYFIHCPGEKVIAFAGLWAARERPGGESETSCALLTAKAAPGIAFIHPRMPVVLKPEHQAAWLDPATTPDRVQAILADARQDPAGYPVGTRVNDVRNDFPELLDKVETRSIGTLDFGDPALPRPPP